MVCSVEAKECYKIWDVWYFGRKSSSKIIADVFGRILTRILQEQMLMAKYSKIEKKFSIVLIVIIKRLFSQFS